MGFRKDSYAKVWSIEPISDTNTKIRISVSRKNKETDEYEQEFSGFVNCYGSIAAQKAARLKEGDKIKLGDVDVTTRYDKEKKVEYVNYKMFSFELDEERQSAPAQSRPAPSESNPVDGGGDDDLPF